MKKFLMCLLAVVLGVSMFACNTRNNDTIYVYVPDGAPALSIASLMYEDEKLDGKNVKYVVINPNNIRDNVLKDTPDFAIIPTNVAANLYNKNAGYKLAATVTHGNLYIVGKTDITGETMLEKLDMLKNKHVGVIGQNAVPDMTFRYILNNYELTEDVTVSYCSNALDAITKLNANLIDFALFAEPAVAIALGNNSENKIAFDLGDIWEDITDNRLYPQAALIVKDGTAIELLNDLIQKMTDSETWAETNPTETLTAIATHMLEGTGTTVTALTDEIVKRCNIKIIKSGDAKEAVDTYLEAIKTINAEAIGGKLPDADFYL